MNSRYRVERNDNLGRYLVAAKAFKAGEKIFSEEPFALGPHGDTSLVCFDCYLPLMSKFVVCKTCGVAPICSGDGCPKYLTKWHDKEECELFSVLKSEKCLGPMVMVQNVGSLMVLRCILKRRKNTETWNQFLELESHIEKRKNTSTWAHCDITKKFIEMLNIVNEHEEDKDLVQRVCAIIDINSFEVRGPPVPAIGCAESLRGIYLQAALLAHDCVSNTSIAIDDNNCLTCHASVDIAEGQLIYYNYTDPLKGTAFRQQHLLLGKYFLCECERCSDPTEMGTYTSSVVCFDCKMGYVSKFDQDWECNRCKRRFSNSVVDKVVRGCFSKFDVVNKTDENDLEKFIKDASSLLAPNHFIILDAKQRLAGVLRDAINTQLQPTKRLLRRKIELCQELLPIIEKLIPGISRIRAITLYELHATIVQLAKKLFDARELTTSKYMSELLNAEKYLKQSLEMLFIEPGNSPEGELCSKAFDELTELKSTMSKTLDCIHAEGKSFSIN